MWVNAWSMRYARARPGSLSLTTLLNIHGRRCFCFPQAFHNYKKVMLKGKEASRFARLMDPLIQSAYPTEALVRDARTTTIPCPSV